MISEKNKSEKISDDKTIVKINETADIRLSIDKYPDIFNI